MTGLPARCTILEVGPRDGLQNEARPVATSDKLRLIGALVDAGLRRIEATSFVNPARVPQMADAEAVMASVPRDRGVAWSGLVLNARGAQRALSAGCDELTFALVASETFSQRNQGQTVAQGLAAWQEVAALAHASGRRAALIVAAAFGCPFEGRVAPARVLDLVRAALPARPDEVALADTIGVAVPTGVAALFGDLAALLRGTDTPMRAHFHNTRNTGYANAAAALGAGVSVLDASAGGVGGCPFAPRATGNIATEDLVYLLDGMGVAHGVDGAAVAALDPWLAEVLGHPVPGQLGKVTPWPPAPPGAQTA